MEDHHVDRLGVEAQQCVKLTSTNRSIGLIALIISAHSFRATGPGLLEREWTSTKTRLRFQKPVLCWPGDTGGAPTPDPIPNSAVKGSSADGTVS